MSVFKLNERVRKLLFNLKSEHINTEMIVQKVTHYAQNGNSIIYLTFLNRDKNH